VIPYSITVAKAPAPDALLRSISYGAVVVQPVILSYTGGVFYWSFRGKLRKSETAPDASALNARVGPVSGGTG
jgi:cytochrome d ubiquinol oxidase subunit II